MFSPIFSNNYSTENDIVYNNISNKIGCFVSIPKNASKSILEILNLGVNRNEDSSELRERYVIYENHQTLQVLETKYNLDKLFVFAFSRNPYDRTLSWFKYHQHIKPYDNMNFEEWIYNGCPHHWTKQNETYWKGNNLTPLLQYNFVKKNHIDYIGKIENFENDLNYIIKILNDSCKKKHITHRFKNINIIKNRSSRRKDYEKYYNVKMKKMIFNMFKQDFIYFKYEP